MVTKKDKEINKYATKLYNSELKILKEKIKRDGEDIIDAAIRWFTTDDNSKKRGRRLSPTSSQGKVVIDKCKRKCVCCPKKYDKDPEDFQIHHIDGDRTHTITRNLILVCYSCHKKIHTTTNARLKDYSVTYKRNDKVKKQKKSGYNPYGF